jgi:hypothetical protein
MTTPPTTTEPLTFLRRRADVSTATRSPCSGGRSATASCSAAIPTHRPRSPRDAAADTRRRSAGEYRRNQQRDRLPSESDPSVTIIGPGAGPPLAGQGVLSDLIESNGRARARDAPRSASTSNSSPAPRMPWRLLHCRSPRGCRRRRRGTVDARNGRQPGVRRYAAAVLQIARRSAGGARLLPDDLAPRLGLFGDE